MNLYTRIPEQLRPWLALIAVLVVCVLAFVFVQTFKSDALIPDGASEITSGAALGVFYYTDEYDDEARTETIKVFRLNPSLLERDELVYTAVLKGSVYIVADTGKPNTAFIYAHADNTTTVTELDLGTGEARETMRHAPAENDMTLLGSLRYLDDGAILAYVTGTDTGGNVANSKLHMRDTATGEVKEYLLREGPGPKYAGFEILAETESTIYLSEMGGDAGIVWGNWHAFDRATGVLTALPELPPFLPNQDYPASYAFSPDHTKIVYASVSAPLPQEDIATQETTFPGCLSSGEAMDRYEPQGGTVVVRDLTSGEERELYRSQVHPDNYCKNLARRVFDVAWIDEDTVAAVVLDGVISIDVATANEKTLYTFTDTNHPGGTDRPGLAGLALPYIAFSDGRVGAVGFNKELKPLPEPRGSGEIFIPN